MKESTGIHPLRTWHTSSHAKNPAQADLIPDLYVQEAAKIFGVLPEKVTATQRKVAKLTMLRKMYSSEPHKL